LITRDYNRRLSDEEFTYDRCGACGLLYLDPVPPDLGRFYPKNYYTIPDSVAALGATLPAVQYKMEIVRRFASSGRLLEIGPACGDFALQAKEAGFEVEAIEMDPRCCEFLTQHVGVRAVCSQDTCAALRGLGQFDVIAMWHVIEHLPNALETFAFAAAKLNRGGVLLVATPNPDAFQFRVLGQRWTHVDAPRHVVLIPLEVLKKEAQRNGLESAWTTTDDEGARGWNRFGWEYSLANFAVGRRPKKWLRRLGRGLSAALQPWDRREGKGSAYTAVFRKAR
jgi:2-polyprenyl-3-methyl-5-hydroxy-6-metoxy-1,4-benzoquinol methylase